MGEYLNLFKAILGSDADGVEDIVLQYYLDRASDVICDIRNSNKVEKKYINVGIDIAVELFSKRGAEGETGHSENGLSRSYENASISEHLLSQITPMAKLPNGEVRVINE